MNFAGDIAVIHLGINDTDPRDWPNYRDDFVRDYLSLIDSCRKANPKSRIMICRLTPISNRHFRFESGTRDWHGEIQLAIETQFPCRSWVHAALILHQACMPHPNMFPDGLHPNPEGAKLLAQTIYSAITGDFGGLKLPPTFTDYMVLQRDCPLPIRGTANAGTPISVCIGHQKQTTITGNDGKWEVTLNPLQTGNDYELNISAGKENEPSVMWLPVKSGYAPDNQTWNFYFHKPPLEKEDIPQANHPDLRLYNMKGNWATDNQAWQESALDSVNHLLYYRTAQWEPSYPTTSCQFFRNCLLLRKNASR